MSDMFKLNWRDFVKGLAIAVISAVLLAVQQALTDQAGIDWGFTLNAALAAGVGYLLKNLMTDDEGKLLGAV